MAITNAQQYKQLVNPPLDGKRPGYRGDAAYRSASAQSKSIGQGNVGSKESFGGGKGTDSSGKDEGAAGADYSAVTSGPYIDNKTKLEEFKSKRPEVTLPSFSYLNFFKGPIQKFADFTAAKNRPFFEDVIRAGKLEGVNFATVSDMTEEQLEQAYKDYMSERLAGNIDAYGNPLNKGDGGGGDGIMSDYERRLLELENQLKTQQAAAATPTTTQNPFAYRFFADGGFADDDTPVGGIMDLETSRQMYGLGKLVKKATRAVKKVAKSPIGKAALLYGLGAMGGSLGAGKGLFSKGMFNLANMKAGLFGQAMKPGFAGPGIPGLFNKLGLTKTAGSLMPTLKGGIALASLAPLVFQTDEEEEFDPYRGPDIDIDKIRSDPYAAMGQAYRFAADGGIMRSAYQEGGDAEPVAKKTMPLIDMDGKEKDYRETGGFVDMGRMERADDVPARLSKNEFVFTANAVRNAGEGDIDKGAEVMYNMMKNLEAGGEVSEESQGLEGARNMFQTSQRLGEVI